LGPFQPEHLPFIRLPARIDRRDLILRRVARARQCVHRSRPLTRRALRSARPACRSSPAEL